LAKLSLRGVKKRFKNTEVLHGIDLEIGDREFVVFVGPSGCGKSTLLRLIAGLDPITEGEFVLNGKRMNEVHPSQRGIAMVFQSYALYPHMDVYENMAFGARLMGLSKPRSRTASPRPPACCGSSRTAAAQAARAQRRPAPARRHRPGFGAQARRCSCSMSRSAISMPRCAPTCASKSRASTARSAAP
jgi:ABC-type sugar transport system ATPase subunit